MEPGLPMHWKLRLLPAVVSGCLGILLVAAPAASAVPPSPHQIIRDTADDLLAVMSVRRAEFEANPAQLRGVVDNVLRPHFDVDYASRLILGRYWPRSTEDQRRRFTEALYGSMVRRYSAGLLEFEENTVEIIPHRGLIRLDEEYVTVRTLVNLDTGVQVPVDYRTRWTGDQWKVFDVIVEGRSYVTFYRDQIGQDVKQKGLDQVIADLGSG
jgi:phospholipid transport system substrate-binding protein